MFFLPRNFARRIVYIAKLNCAGGTSCLASGDNFTICNMSILFLGRNPRGINALHTVSAFLHDSTHADCHIWILQEAQHGWIIMRIVEEIESPHFIWAI